MAPHVNTLLFKKGEGGRNILKYCIQYIQKILDNRQNNIPMIAPASALPAVYRKIL